MRCPTCGLDPDANAWENLNACCTQWLIGTMGRYPPPAPCLVSGAAEIFLASQQQINDFLGRTIKEFKPPVDAPIPEGMFAPHKCECGALKSKTTHARWCPARPAQPGD